MPIVKTLSAKEGAAIEYYCNPDSETLNNWTQSYKNAGYSLAKGWKQNSGKVLIKPRIRQAIADYREKTGQKWAHDRQVAVDGLNLNMVRLQAQADSGNIAAINAVTTIYRELNAISSLHTNTVINKGDGLNINITEAGVYPRKVKDRA